MLIKSDRLPRLPSPVPRGALPFLIGYFVAPKVVRNGEIRVDFDSEIQSFRRGWGVEIVWLGTQLHKGPACLLASSEERCRWKPDVRSGISRALHKRHPRGTCHYLEWHSWGRTLSPVSCLSDLEGEGGSTAI